MFFLLLVPALIAPAPAVGVPDSVEMAPGLFVLKGAPTAATYSALKGAGITHVINLRRDGEKDFDSEAETFALAAVDVSYIRLALPKVPPKGDLDLFRSILKDLPKNARVLVHCNNGNRAAGVIYTCLVLDRGVDYEKALALAREAGLASPETETAMKAYVNAKKQG